MKQALSFDEAEKIVKIVYDFIEKNKISCPEATCEDRVYENAPDLVFELAEIIGYYEYPEDDE